MRLCVWMSALVASVVLAGCVRDTTELRVIPDPTASDRPHNHGWSGLRLVAPGEWPREQYSVEMHAGADPGDAWSGAPYGMRIVFEPEADERTSSPLMTVLLYTETQWRAIAETDGEPVGQALDVYDGWALVARLPETNPYETGTAAWEDFESMRLEYDDIADMLTHPRSPMAGPGEPLEYEAELPAASGSGRVVRLTLEYDGAAELTTVYVEEQDRFEEPGAWWAKNDLVTMRFEDEEAAPMQWRRVGDDLVPEAWDERQYGAEGLPLTRVREEPAEDIM